MYMEWLHDILASDVFEYQHSANSLDSVQCLMCNSGVNPS